MPDTHSHTTTGRSQLRVRNLSAGVVYHLLFDGSLAFLSGAQLRTHLQGISQVPASEMELFVEVPAQPTTTSSDGGRDDDEKVSKKSTVLAIADATRGADVGLHDGMTVYMRIQAQREGRTEQSRPAPPAAHTHAVPTSSSAATARTLSRLAPPTPLAPSCALLASQAGRDPITSSNTQTTRRGVKSPLAHLSGVSGDAAARDERAPYDAGPSWRAQTTTPPAAENPHCVPSKTSGRSRSRHTPSRTPRSQSSRGAHTRIVVAPAWDTLSTTSSFDDRRPQGAAALSRSATAAPAPSKKAVLAAGSNTTHNSPSPAANANTNTSASANREGNRDASVQRVRANDLEELLAEQEYVWRMERQRFETERAARLRLIEERQRQFAYEAARLRREECLWSAKAEFERSRVASLQTALEREVEVRVQRLADYTHSSAVATSDRARGGATSPRQLTWQDSSRRQNGGLFDSDDEISVDVVVNAEDEDA